MIIAAGEGEAGPDAPEAEKAANGRYHTNACRQRAYRKRKRQRRAKEIEWHESHRLKHYIAEHGTAANQKGSGS